MSPDMALVGSYDSNLGLLSGSLSSGATTGNGVGSPFLAGIPSYMLNNFNSTTTPTNNTGNGGGSVNGSNTPSGFNLNESVIVTGGLAVAANQASGTLGQEPVQ